MKNIKTAALSSLVTILVVIIVFLLYDKFTYQENNTTPHTEIVKSPVQNNNTEEPTTQEQKVNANNEITNSRYTLLTETIEKVSPAVVGITVTEVRQYRDPMSMDPIYRMLFGDRVVNREVKGLGSGVIISPDGYIITNDHVAGNGKKIAVTMTDGTELNAEIIGTDLVSDICLLKIEGNNFPYVNFDESGKLIIGEWVIALGNPFGLFRINDKPTVTVGVISATGMNLGTVRDRYYIDMIQTDASINTGNSGGPLINSLGELIGLNTLIYSESGGSVGVGFAIPITKVQKIINELKNGGFVDRNFWTGITIQNVDERIAQYYGLNSTKGVIITLVSKNSPAEKAGIIAGDIVLEVDDYKITDESTMLSVLQDYRTNEKLQIKILRENKQIIKSMKLEKRND